MKLTFLICSLSFLLVSCVDIQEQDQITSEISTSLESKVSIVPEFSLDDLTAPEAPVLGVQLTKKAKSGDAWIVSHVVPGSPADKAGIKGGDAIWFIGDVDLNSVDSPHLLREILYEKITQGDVNLGVEKYEGLEEIRINNPATLKDVYLNPDNSLKKIQVPEGEIDLQRPDNDEQRFACSCYDSCPDQSCSWAFSGYFACRELCDNTCACA